MPSLADQPPDPVLSPNDEAVLHRYAVDVGLWEIGIETRRLRVSERWARMLGLEAAGIERWDDHWVNRIDERDRERVVLEFRTHLAGLSRTLETEYRMRHRDGSVRWVRTRGRLRRDDKGKAHAMAGQQEDITDRRSADDQLRGAEHRFRTLVELAPDAVGVIREGKLIYGNGRLAALLGAAPPEAMAGTLFLGIVSPHDREAAERLLEGAGHGPGATTGELSLSPEAGRPAIPVELSATAFTYEGQPAILCVARDLAERKRLQARVAQTERLASLGRLAAGVAHEINNPLTYASTNIEIITKTLARLVRVAHTLTTRQQGEDESPEVKRLMAEAGPLLDPGTYQELLEQAEDARSGSARVQDIIGDLKVFARADGEPRRPVGLTAVLDLALRMTRHEAKLRARVTRDFTHSPPVLAHDGRLCQVFVNLLVNAAQSIPPGGRQEDHEIRVSLRAEGDEAVVEIADTGAGIPRDHLSRVFEPFFTTKPAGVGSGLGLAICSHIVADYGGRIEVDSEVGRGTRVTVRLPAWSAADDLTEVAPKAVEPPERDAARRRHRVLIVDDEPALCRALQRALIKQHDVQVVTSGREAIDLLRDDRAFSVVLCDLILGELSGQDVFQAARQHDLELASRFVFMTGGITDPGVREFLGRVPQPVIEKPVSIDALERFLDTLPTAPASAARKGNEERRRAPRRQGRETSCIVRASAFVRRCGVVDYSIHGLRVRAAADWPTGAWGSRAPFSILLDRPGGNLVQADVELVRLARGPQGQDLCFEIVQMDDESRRQYEGWLSTSAVAA